VRDTLVIIDVSSSSRIGSGIGIQLTLFEAGELAPVFMIVCTDTQHEPNRKRTIQDAAVRIDTPKADYFRHLFRVVKVALDSVSNHLTQISKRIGFGGNSMTERGCNKASIDKIFARLGEAPTLICVRQVALLIDATLVGGTREQMP